MGELAESAEESGLIEDITHEPYEKKDGTQGIRPVFHLKSRPDGQEENDRRVVRPKSGGYALGGKVASSRHS